MSPLAWLLPQLSQETNQPIKGHLPQEWPKAQAGNTSLMVTNIVWLCPTPISTVCSILSVNSVSNSA